jgi:iron complex transport system substrate-binding protein
MSSSLSRRGMLIGAGALTATTLFGACSASTPRSAEPTSSASTTGFPATVEHKYGSTVVPAQPQRIVTVGYTEQDTVLALGATVVGVTEWYGEQPYATWPWAQAALGEAKPTVLSSADGFALEKIAALAPDLIIGTNAGMTKEDYGKLSKIAPTVANSGRYSSDWFEPWDTQTAQIAAALGQPAQGAELVARLKSRFAEVAAAHPQFTGTKAIFLQAPYYEGKAIAYQNGLSTDFLTDLGFVVPAEIDKYATDEGQAYIPVEKLDVLNAADVLIWATENDKAQAELTRNKLFGQLEAVRANRSIYTGGELAGAIYFATVLSLPYVLDRLVPQLAKALPPR